MDIMYNTVQKKTTLYPTAENSSFSLLGKYLKFDICLYSNTSSEFNTVSSMDNKLNHHGITYM